MYAIFSSYSDNPLSKIEIIKKVFCFGKEPINVWTPDGDVIETSSPISNPKVLLKSLPIEIVFLLKFFEPKNFSLFEISSDSKSFFK